MAVGARRWSGVEQSMLLVALRSGRPPAAVCRELGRSPQEVRHRLHLLLGDPPMFHRGDAAAALDVVWLRLHGESVLPGTPSPADVVAMWEQVTGVELTVGQRARFAADELMPELAATGRHALLVTARSLHERTGDLRCEDWLEQARTHVPSGPDPLMLARAAVDDVAPARARRALARHLGFTDPGPDDPAARRAAVVEVTRAAGLPQRPAAALRERLAGGGLLATLQALPVAPSLTVATTLAVLAGHDETDAPAVAGRLMTPWHTPPNLGRGAVVHVPR